TFLSTSTPPPPPPQITASASPEAESDDVVNRTLMETKTRTASEVAPVQPVVTAGAFSNLAIPDNFSIGTDLSMSTIAGGELSFGLSMGGLGGVSNMGSIPAGMRSRCTLAQRMERLRENGGEDRAERAVVKGLEFLASKQNRETGAFGDVFTAGMSGLALLAFLGHCETPESMKFGNAVSGAAIYLMDRCRNNEGKISNGTAGDHETYEHAIATYALAELFTMSNESGNEIPQLEAVLRRAVDVIIKAQSDDGGWPYGFDREQTSDMSVTSWHVQALKAAYNTGRTFPGVQASLDKATTGYIPSIQDSGGAFKYKSTDRDGRPSLTAAALLSMEIWKGSGTLHYNKGLEYLIKRYEDPVPRMDGIFYATYYNTQFLFLVGGKPWEDYNRKLQPWLLDSQNADGSWTTDGGVDDRQFYNTAWAILMLEVYYRYLPTTDKSR
ncbi:MAG: prenyltransferase/squalene oxidase repeat-containing protein, partial [Verrucomicrobiales bacterium]